MKTLRILISLIIAFSVIPASSAYAKDGSGDIPWKLMPKTKKLNHKQKEELKVILKTEFNYGDCPDTILNCLIQKKPDKTALRITNFAAYLMNMNVPARSLPVVFKERAKFAHPAKIYKFNLEKSPVNGEKDAPITLVEFAEFKCPYCKMLVDTIDKIVLDSNGKVRHVFKHYPLKSHSGTVICSKASEAAHRQGKFWKMYNALYRYFDKQSEEDIMKYAKDMGLDMEKFKKDMNDPMLIKKIENDKIEGVRAKVSGTPTFYINGKIYLLRNDEAFLKDIINEEAERLGIAPPYKDQ